MSDAFEDRARELAHSLPLCDFGSSQAILAMAQAFRDDDARIRALHAEIIGVLESAGNALCDVGSIHTTDKIDDILKRLKGRTP